MRTLLTRVALMGAMLVPLAAAPAHAQGPTPEGTVITNTATASYTDANGNAYTDATASVTVTVGFLAGVDVIPPAGPLTPSSPSTGNTAVCSIDNTGNGDDTFTFSASGSAGITITGYQIGATSYADLAALNAALAGMTLGMGDPAIDVTVLYDVADGHGGATLTLDCFAESRRDTDTEETETTNVTPSVSAGVNVTPDGGASSRLPSNGGATTYTETFTVTNTGNAEDTYTVGATSSNGSAVVISGISGTGVSGGQVTIPAGESVVVTVTYTVPDGATEGSTSTITLTATSNTDGTETDTGTVVVTVVKAALDMTKQAYRADQTTLIGGADQVLPGETIYYLVTVTNNGTAAASDVVVSDPLPNWVSYTSGTATSNTGTWTFGWAANGAHVAGTNSPGTLTGTLTGTLAASGSASFWIPVTVY